MISRRLLLLAIIASVLIAAPARAQDNDKPVRRASTPIESGQNDNQQPILDQPAPAPTEGAEGDQPPPAKDAPPKQPQKQDFSFFFIMIGVFVLMWFIMGRSRKKREAERRKMLSEIKKGDKVTSIGGIVGTIMDVREDEVVVKVDENNNIRMRLARWAIRGVGEAAKAEDEQKG